MKDRGKNRKLQNAGFKFFKRPCKTQVNLDGSGQDQQRNAKFLEENAEMLKRGESFQGRFKTPLLLIPKLEDMLYL
jgi:hypothetical protein